MKRNRPERPSGRPKYKERQVCLKCGRNISRVERCSKKPYQKTWLCRKCWMWYGYLDGVLLGVAGRTTSEWWETKGEWRLIPDGLLMVYGGEGIP